MADKALGEFNIEARIIEISSKGNLIVIEDDRKLKTRVTLPDHNDKTQFATGDTVIVWIDKLLESNPA